MILAGAGSGKTKVLASRVAYIIQENLCAPWQILALTFTNKAARELRERCVSMAGNEGVKVAAGTFHSMFANFLRQNYAMIGLDAKFTIMDTDDKRRLLKEIIKEHFSDKDNLNPNFLDSTISNIKSQNIRPKDFMAKVQNEFETRIALAYSEYEKKRLRMNAFDFDDLLLFPLEAMKLFPEFLAKLQKRFHYVMVDEFQDTNYLQYQLVCNIAHGTGNLCVVGDDDQSIYGWRGAMVSNILDFKRDWKNAKIVKLEQNYRSTSPILKSAWHIIKNNSHRHPKELWTTKEGGEQIDLIKAYSADDEARLVITRIQDMKRDFDYDYKDIAILYRTNSQSLAFEDTLRSLRMPYQIVGGFKFYMRKEIKDFLAYLRLVVNHSDDVSFTRVVNYPPRGIGQTTLNEIVQYSNKYRISMFKAVQSMVQTGLFSGKIGRTLGAFHNLILKTEQRLAEMPIDQVAQWLFVEVGLKDRISEEEKSDRSKTESKLANIGVLIEQLKQFSSRVIEGTLEEFLEEVALIADVDELENDTNKVSLMTLHSSKGLEFKLVAIVGLEEGILPLKSPSNEIEDVEEERRLMYVGITRAKEKLILSYATSRSRWGQTMYNEKSRFLTELPEEYYILINDPSNNFKNVAPKPYIEFGARDSENWFNRRTSNQQSPSHAPSKAEPSAKGALKRLTSEDVRYGQLVKHATFGVGLVIKVSNSGDKSEVKVDFDDHGIKTLRLAYAPLELVR